MKRNISFLIFVFVFGTSLAQVKSDHSTRSEEIAEVNEITRALFETKQCAVFLSATFKQKNNGESYSSSVDFTGNTELAWDGTTFFCAGSSNDGIDSIVTKISGKISVDGSKIIEGKFIKDRRSLEWENTYGTSNWKVAVQTIPYSNKTDDGFVEFKLSGNAVKAVLNDYVNKFYSASYSYSDEANIVWSRPVELSIQFWK